MSFKRDLLHLLKPYYLINILLSLSYVICKKLPGLCNYLFNVEYCEFDGRESEILFFLLIVVMVRSRKTGSVTMINYLSASFIYTKFANLILWFYADFIMGIIYGIVFILSALLVPEPTYSGQDNVVYFNTYANLEEELGRSKNKVWLIAFYTVWSPACVNLAPMYAQLSRQYDLNNLKFGKLDISRSPEAAKKFKINDSSFSKQLPTIVLFKNGTEYDRRPMIDSKGKIIKFLFAEDNIKAAFDLANIYEVCKKQLGTKTSGHIKSD